MKQPIDHIDILGAVPFGEASLCCGTTCNKRESQKEMILAGLEIALKTVHNSEDLERLKIVINSYKQC